MKKVFTFVAAALCAVTMSAATTFTFASINDANKTKNGITLTIAKGGGQNDPAWNDKASQLRVYAKNTITISGSNITKVELTCGKTKSDKEYASMTADKGNLVSGGQSTTVGSFVTDTWTGNVNEVVFTIGEKGQRCIEEIVVTTNGEGGGEGEDGDDGDGGDEEQDGETITVAKALEIGDALAKGGKTTTEYLVKGYVVTAYDFDTEHKNQSFYLSDDKDAERGDFFAKYTTGDIVKEGDLVIVSGNIEKYEKNGKTTIEIFRGVAKVVSEGEDGDGGEGDGGEGQGGGQGDADVTITGLQYADAYYSEGYWEFDLYNDFDYDNGDYIYPEVYFSADEEALSKTSIVGTYSAYYAGYWKSAKDSIETDEYEPIGTLTVTCVGEYLYNFVGSFVGQDGKTYKWNATNVLVVWVIDYDNDEEIELTDMPMAVENTEANVQSAIKTLRNGQVLIQKNNKVYTVLGQEVK